MQGWETTERERQQGVRVGVCRHLDNGNCVGEGFCVLAGWEGG